MRWANYSFSVSKGLLFFLICKTSCDIIRLVKSYIECHKTAFGVLKHLKATNFLHKMLFDKFFMWLI